MKADRLLSTLLLLQAHGRLTGREMAKRLEVSMRTVHRDMEALSAAGVPVFALRGAQGGWQLDKGWRTQAPGLDETELQALLMSQPRVMGDVRLAAAAENALAKLVASLPAAMRERAASIRQRLHVDTAGWRGTGENLAMLPIVQDAVARDRRIANSSSAQSTRSAWSRRVPLGTSSRAHRAACARFACRASLRRNCLMRSSSVRRISISPPRGRCLLMSFVTAR